MKAPSLTKRAQGLRLGLIGTAAGASLALLLTGQSLASIAFSGACWLIYLLGTLRPGCGWFGPVMTSITEDKPCVLITIDDGPHPDTTPALLEVLNQHGAKAVFFLIGDRAQRHPELVRAIAKAGHGIGNHSMTHPSGTYWMLGPWRMWREIRDCQTVLKQITGSAPRWYRSPVGHSNPFVQPVLSALNLHRMAWSARGYDTIRTNVEVVMRALRPGMRAGAIILLHEGTPMASELLRQVLKELQAKGLQSGLWEC